MGSKAYFYKYFHTTNPDCLKYDKPDRKTTSFRTISTLSVSSLREAAFIVYRIINAALKRIFCG